MTIRSSAVPKASRELQGSLGTLDLVFSVLAFNAPLAVFIGYITVIIGYGNGLGAPVAYIAAGALMLIFAVGFLKMTHHMKNPGAFYAYVTAGLGKPLGLGTAFVAIVSYFFLIVGAYSFGGVALNGFVVDTLNGPDIPWFVYSAAFLVVTGILGYFKITLSAKVLTVFMGAEVLIIIAYNVVVFATGGAEGVSLAPFAGENIFSGSVGIAVLFGITCYSGFEATAAFREEVRDPVKTITRATMAAILTLAIMYSISAWGLITGVGVSSVIDASAADPTGTAEGSIATYLGNTVLMIASALLVTSLFAAGLATHNVATRYVYSLSKDEVLPASLSHVHGRHGSPHRSALLTSIVSALFLSVLVIAGVDGGTIYAVLVGIAGYALILMLLLVCIAVIALFARHRGIRENRLSTLVLPSIGAVGLFVALILATVNIEQLVVGGPALAYGLLGMYYALIIAGVAVALVLRVRRPQTYARLGRQEPVAGTPLVSATADATAHTHR